MNSKISELFYKKHYWESKRDNLYNRMLWDCCCGIPPWLAFYFLVKDGFFDRKTENKWILVIEITFLLFLLFLFLFSMFRNIYNCYYKLPYYRRKINEIDHLIIEELKNLTINSK